MSDLDGVADGLPNHHRPGSCPTTRRRTASADSHPTKSLGMHSLLPRLDLVPELLVGLAPAVWPIPLQSCRWLADSRDRRTGERLDRLEDLPALSLPHDHELHQDLPEGAQRTT